MKNEKIYIENTKFIYKTNFGGDPERGYMGSTTRLCNIIIPTVEQAEELISNGINVRTTNPREGYEDEYEPEYYVKATVSYRRKDGSLQTGDYYPEIILVADGCDNDILDEDTAANADHVSVKNVNVILRVFDNPNTGRKSLYVSKLYIEQDTELDPFANRYRN